MIKIVFIMMFFLVFAGCDAKEKEARLEQERLARTFTTKSYNYTPYQLYYIAFKDVSLPFKIDEAPSGGSIFYRSGNKDRMDNGEKVSFSEGNCCFIWDGAIDQPRRVRVVWSVVYDESRVGEGDYDQRKSRKSAPGSQWCQAIVDILPASGAERPSIVFLHFLNDGSVQANLGTFKSGSPLPSAQVKLHSDPLPQGQYCKQEIENPFYGIPRKPLGIENE